MEMSNDQHECKTVCCLYCKTGCESLISQKLRLMEIEHMVAYRRQLSVRNGVETLDQRALMPGYVFFEADAAQMEDLTAIESIPGVFFVLHYEKQNYALRGRDLEFYRWLKELGGVIDTSKVLREGTRVRVLSGPLKNFSGSIVSVNKKRRCVAISLGDDSLMQKIWCSIEYVEQEDEG